MNNEYEKIIPRRFWLAKEEDVPESITQKVRDQIANRNGLYFWGNPGVGKTHLVCAIIKILLGNFKVKYFNVGDLLERLRAEFNKPEVEEGILEQIMNFKGVLVLDDIGAEKASEWTRERLYLIINKRYEDMFPTIFTSNYNLSDLQERLGDRITSRIAGSTLDIKISGVDQRLN